MTLRGDDRAVAVQIGAVILLGFLVVSLSVYQATVVPNENQQVEFQHSQRVQSDMLEVRNAILGTAATGSAAPATVELGTRYPARAVAVNPAPPSGTLSTSSLGQVSIRNAAADDATTTEPDYPETADFWDGTTHNYTTKSLEYRPSYANYDNAPTTVYENGLVYNRFRSGTVTRGGQSVVAGTRISLVALSGNLSQGGASSLLVDPQPVSVSTRTISVTNDAAGENVSVVVPSELSANEWRNLLNETGDYDPAADSSNGAYVYRVADRTAGVELYFEAGATYQLKLSKVGIGQGVGDTEPAYLTSVEDLIEDPFVDRTYPFVVESRDKYNNPVANQTAAAAERGSVPDGTGLEPGQYRYQYDAPGSAGADTVNVTYLTGSGDPVYDTRDPSFDGDLVENVQYGVSVQAGSGGGGGDGSDTGSLSLKSGSGEADANDGDLTGIQFLIESTWSSSATIERISLSTDAAASVFEGNSGTGDGQREVFIDSGDDDANTENADDGYYESGENKVNQDSWSIGTDVALSETAEVAGSGSARFYIYEFYDSSGGNANTVDMSGKTVSVTITYSVDSTQYTTTFDVTT